MDTSSKETLALDIDAHLPQTQCGECGYAGCMPYARAIAENHATINHCAPGGTETIVTLAQLLKRDPKPFLDQHPIQKKPVIAHIREADCIGCTKCIQACPVDAIIGAAKQMHSILKAECTGCGLCVTPCPMDCIELLPVKKLDYQPEQARQRFLARNRRLLSQEKKASVQHSPALAVKKAFIEAAILRTREKKRLTRNEAGAIDGS